MAEIGYKKPHRQTYSNLYHYAGNNPVKYTDPTGLSDEDGIPAFNFKIEPIYDYEGKQRAEALEKARPFYFQFEGRNKKNTITESYENNGDWSLLTYDMSLLHQNGIGDPELKFICKDGREAVFTRDF